MAGALGTMAAPLAAQPRVTVDASAGYQPTSTRFEDGFMPNLHEESGSTDVAYPIESGAIVDAGAAVRLWRGLGAGVAVSRFSHEGVAPTRSLVPHPFFFRRFREVIGDARGIERNEMAVHLQAQYALPPAGPVQVVVMGGPSVLRVEQTIVTRVNYTEEYPYDEAAFSGADTRRVDGSAAGFNVGADVRWMVTRHVGAGVLVRYTRATIDLAVADTRAREVEAGGAHIAAGVRLAF